MRIPFPLLLITSLCVSALLPVLSEVEGRESSPAAVTFPADPVPQWIWHGDAAPSAEPVLFRKEIRFKRANSVKLFASCDDEMIVFINGKKIIEQKGWKNVVYKDITDHFEPGRNIVAIRGANRKGSAGLLMRLVFEVGRDEPFAIVTDESWKVFSGRTPPDWKEIGFNDRSWAAAESSHKLGEPPRAEIDNDALARAANLRAPAATPVDRLFVKEGFKVELLYSVPRETQGSWVAMTTDDKGRFIVSDQYGSLYRFGKPGPGETLREDEVEKIDIDLGHAQGLVYAFDSLYVVVNSRELTKGFYRVRDTDGDDKFDKVELLREFHERVGEHGPHAVLLAPDGKSLYVVSGNQTALPEFDLSRVPPVWQEDQLLPRIYGRGFMRGALAPRGWIAKTDPDGKRWEILATGFRNEYDAAFNADGELFTYDADMELDINTSWYRPTRVCHVPSGAEFGWRNGSAKWPAYYLDSLPATVDIGPGSPTGVTFGYGARFPAKYQNAFFICDWSYGKMYAVHLEPRGASYTGAFEEFVSAQPLPLTDLLVHPEDGAMYFAIGGRRVQSGLYRVTYTGAEPVAPAPGTSEKGKSLRKLRRELEAFHGVRDARAVETAWPHLSHRDRFIRYAARTAIEHQPVDSWKGRALEESNPVAAIEALTALARVAERDGALFDAVHEALTQIEYDKLTLPQRLAFLRARGLNIIRLLPEGTQMVASQLDDIDNQLEKHFPAGTAAENIELSQLLVRADNPNVVPKAIALLKTAPTQEEQIAIAKNIRSATGGWTKPLREDFFKWINRAKTYRGGASISLFIGSIRNDALSGLPPAVIAELKPILEAQPETSGPQFTCEPRAFVKNWTLDDLAPALEGGFLKRNYENGRNLFGAASCFACHRFDNQGGAVGPDLTSVSGKFSARDLLESIISPSKEISDQYGSVLITKNDDTQVVGRIVNLSGDSVRVMPDMLDPSDSIAVDRKQIVGMVDNPVSMMPPMLLNTLEQDDILDLLAYLLSGGDPGHAMFK